jgi:hypothetical protein
VQDPSQKILVITKVSIKSESALERHSDDKIRTKWRREGWEGKDSDATYKSFSPTTLNTFPLNSSAGVVNTVGRVSTSPVVTV